MVCHQIIWARMQHPNAGLGIIFSSSHKTPKIAQMKHFSTLARIRPLLPSSSLISLHAYVLPAFKKGTYLSTVRRRDCSISMLRFARAWESQFCAMVSICGALVVPEVCEWERDVGCGAVLLVVAVLQGVQWPGIVLLCGFARHSVSDALS